MGQLYFSGKPKEFTPVVYAHHHQLRFKNTGHDGANNSYLVFQCYDLFCDAFLLISRKDYYRLMKAPL